MARDFEPQEAMSDSQKKRHANNLMSKHGDHDDLDKPGPVVGASGGKLKRLHVDVAENGYSVGHTIEHEGQESDETPKQPQDHTHVFQSHEEASAHVGHLLRGHHEGRSK